MERTHAGAVEEGEGPPTRGEEAETMCVELATTPSPQPSFFFTAGTKVEPRKYGGVGEGVLRFDFISHYPILV